MTLNIAHNNAHKGILITQDNLTRFNKRLHKAMQEEGLDISYSKAANIFAKACGKKNLHEITELLKHLTEESLPEVKASPLDVNISLDKSFEVMQESQSFEGNLNHYTLINTEILSDFKKSLKNVLASYINNSKVVFQFTPNAPEGSFIFVILRLIDDKLKQDVICYESFVQVNRDLDEIFTPVVNFLNYIFYKRDESKKINFLNNLKQLVNFKPGFNFEFLTSDVFKNIKPIYKAGLYKQSFSLVPQSDFFKIKEKILSDFSYNTPNGVNKSEIVNILNVKALAPYIKGTAPDLKAVMKLLDGFADEAFVFEILEPLSAINDKTLSRFFISKVLKPFCTNKKEKFVVNVGKYGYSSSLYELNNLSDMSFFEGILEKDFPLPSTPVNDPNFNKVYDGFKS